MSRRYRQLTAAAAACVLAAGCTAPQITADPADTGPASGGPAAAGTDASAAPTSTPGPGKVRFGRPLDIKRDGETVGRLTVDTPVLTKSFLDGVITPKGSQFVSFRVTFVAAAEQEADYGLFDFYVRDAAGQHFQPGSEKEPALSGGRAHAGERVSGWITFDAPLHGTLVYDPSAWQGSAAEWTY